MRSHCEYMRANLIRDRGSRKHKTHVLPIENGINKSISHKQIQLQLNVCDEAPILSQCVAMCVDLIICSCKMYFACVFNYLFSEQNVKSAHVRFY